MAVDWRKVNVSSVFKRAGSYSLISFTLIPWKVTEQLILKTLLRHIKENVSVDLPRGEPFLTNLIIFCNEMTGLANKGRDTCISKSFSSVSCGILVEKLLQYGVGEQIVPA